jgi:uncharacterized protein (TIGR00725 family)
MGSSLSEMPEAEIERLSGIARRLGEVIADRHCVLVTGATTGLPALVSRAARARGGLAVGISPAASLQEHRSSFDLPDDDADFIVFTGFGLKGRNVINVRSSDIVVIIGGGIGTLNEFTVAFDEGKVIGVLEGTGGVADQVKAIAALSRKSVEPELVFESNPEKLIDLCLKALAGRK